MKAIAFLSIFAVGAAMVASSASASQLTYVPTNPTFGGNALNGSFLLSTAQGQGLGAKSGQAAATPDLSGLTDALSGLSNTSSTANPTTINLVTPTNP
jgi:curli production assembly/transport component CsgF